MKKGSIRMRVPHSAFAMDQNTCCYLMRPGERSSPTPPCCNNLPLPCLLDLDGAELVTKRALPRAYVPTPCLMHVFLNHASCCNIERPQWAAHLAMNTVVDIGGPHASGEENQLMGEEVRRTVKQRPHIWNCLNITDTKPVRISKGISPLP